MKYLVTMELIGTPPVASRQELVQWLEQMIIPTEEAMIKLEADGKALAGGDLTGRRGMAMIVEAVSNEELSQLLNDIPEWPLLKVEVTPLDSFKERLSEIRKFVKQFKVASE